MDISVIALILLILAFVLVNGYFVWQMIQAPYVHHHEKTLAFTEHIGGTSRVAADIGSKLKQKNVGLTGFIRKRS